MKHRFQLVAPHATGTALLCLTLITSGASLADDTPTLKSLEERDIVIEPSKPKPVKVQEQLQNFRRLLELTKDQKPQTRIPVIIRLADAELDASTDETDPTLGAKRAVSLYKQVLEQDAVKIDRAPILYNLARAHDLAGNIDASRNTLSELINKHSDSPLVAESRFRRAEIYFVQKNYSDAEQDYAALVQRGDANRFFLQSRYKLGWSRYKLSEFRASLNEFTGVLKLLLPPSSVAANGTIEGSGLSKSQQELVNDSLRGITLNFAQLSKDLQPSEYIDSTGLKAYEFLIYKNLLARYQDQERFTDASDTALAFAKRNPNHPQAKEFELQAIQALQDGGFPTLARARKQSFVERYGIERQSWYGKDPLDVPEVNKRLRSYLDEITQSFHAIAQKSGKAEDYQRAAEWYANYLKIFPKIEKAPQIAFLRGEVLFEAGQFAEAARQYEQVGYKMGDNEKAGEAAYAAVLAWRKAAGDAATTDSMVEKATLSFVEKYPAHNQAANALARLAEDRYSAKDLDSANTFAKRLIAHEPPATKAQLANAWRIRAAAAEKANDYPAVEEALGWLLANGEAREKASVSEGLAASIYKQGEALAKAGDDEAAQEQFLRLQEIPAAKGSGADAIRATALFDAAAASVRADDKAESIRLLERFRKNYPRHKLAPEATRKLAALYLETDNKAAAAREFARVREQQDISAQARSDAALQTAKLLEQTEQTKPAINAYETYLKQYKPGFTEAMETRQKIVELNNSIRYFTKADEWRKSIIEADKQAGPQSNKRSKTLAARATLHFADKQRAEFDSAKLGPPLRSTLKTKKSRLETALASYGKAADYGIAEVTTAATFRIGQLYYDFSRALLESPRPSNLKGEELAQYDILLEEQAFPLEEQSISIHKANVDRISKGTYDEWVKKSLTQLGKLIPVRYAKQEKLSNAL